MSAIVGFVIHSFIVFMLVNDLAAQNVGKSWTSSAVTSSPTIKRLYSRGTLWFYNIRTSSIRTFAGISIQRCEQECSRRGSCRGLIYHRRPAYCILSARLRLGGKNKGTVLITGFSQSNVVPCGKTTCSSTETCVDEGKGKVCRITECSRLPSFFVNINGNLNAPTNKVSVKGNPNGMTLTCKENGLWEKSGATVISDCTEVFGISGVYKLKPSMREVYCDMTSDQGHWLVFQRRQDGKENFERPWVDYVNGFGDLNGEFWLGLEAVYQILQTGEYELRVDMTDFSEETRYAKYNTFTLTGAQDNYRLGVSGFSGNAGDCLFNTHSGMMFTTKDKDNDLAVSNCARTYKGAWWYRACHVSNLNGLYYPNGENTTVYATHIHWKTWTGYFISLKRVEMKLRKKWN